MTSSSSALSQMFAEDRILQTIVSNLDSYGVISLLKAFPELQKKAVLITDHEMPPMFFGELPGAQRRLLQFQDVYVDVVKPSWAFCDAVNLTGKFRRQRTGAMPVYCKDTDILHPIKLIETALVTSWSRLCPSTLDNTDCLQHPQMVDLSSSTFIFIAIPYSSTSWNCSRRFAELETRLDRFTDAKWHSGLPTFYPVHAELECDVVDENYQVSTTGRVIENLQKWFGLTPGAVSSNSLQMAASPGFNYESLRTLRIDSVTTLTDGLCLPLVENFSIVFSEPDTCTDRPIIKALFAPALRVFGVHFASVLPLFQDCVDIGTSKGATEWIDDKPTKFEPMLFELADKDRLDHSRFNMQCVSLKNKRVHCEPLELPFLLNFADLIIGGGVPLSLLRPQDLSNITNGLFHFTESPYYIPTELPADWTIHMGKLRILRGHVTSSGIILPKITSDPVEEIRCPFMPHWRPSPDAFSVMFTTLVDDLPTFPRFWKHLTEGPNKATRDLLVYSSPRLLKRKCFDPGDLIQISRQDWFSVFDRSDAYDISRFPYIPVGAISLTGFVMDFLEGPTPPGILGLGPTSVQIQPLVTTANRTITCSVFSTPKNIYVGGPFTLDSSGTAADDWKLDLRNLRAADPFLRKSRGSFPSPSSVFFLGVSPQFTECSLNAEPLSFEPTQDWKDALYQSKRLRYHPRTRVLCHRWRIPNMALDPEHIIQPVPNKDFSTEFFSTAQEFLAHVSHPEYSPYLKFSNRVEPVTLERGRRPPDWTFMSQEDCGGWPVME